MSKKSSVEVGVKKLYGGRIRLVVYIPPEAYDKLKQYRDQWKKQWEGALLQTVIRDWLSWKESPDTVERARKIMELEVEGDVGPERPSRLSPGHRLSGQGYAGSQAQTPGRISEGASPGYNRPRRGSVRKGGRKKGGSRGP